MKKLFALVMALIMLTACFAGCKKETEDKPAIVVGYTVVPPLNYDDGDGNLIGFDTELAKAVFEGMGYKVVFKEIVWANKYTELNAGNIDCIWNGFTCNTADSDDNVQRSDKVDFSYKYMENKQVVVVKKNSGITSPADLAGKIGVAESGSAGEAFAKANIAGAMVDGLKVQTDCLLKVNAMNADFAVVDALLASTNVGKGDYSELTILGGVEGEPEYYAIGFKKGSDLTAKVNAELEKLAADGTIAKLAEKYSVVDVVITDFSEKK